MTSMNRTHLFLTVNTKAELHLTKSESCYMVSQAELILRVITSWFLVLSQFFRDGMGPFKCRLELYASVVSCLTLYYNVF